MPPKGRAKAAKKVTGTTSKARGTKRARSPDAPAASAGAEAIVDAAAGADKPAAKRAKVAAGLTAPDVGDATATSTPVPATSAVAAAAAAPTVVAAPAKAKATPAAAAAPKAPEIDYSGQFDLYSMSLPFLNTVYAPNGATNRVYPEELYKKILTYQAKDDRTAKINLPNGASTGAEGTFMSFDFCDPMEEMPFDIEMSGIAKVPVDKTAALVKGSVYARPGKDQGEWVGEGLKVGIMEIEGGGGCGIASSGGNLSMVSMWAKGEGEDRMELWEGKLTFRVKYSGMYSRKGHGSGQNETYNFWGIRGKK